jgi:hypothetical protein
MTMCILEWQQPEHTKVEPTGDILYGEGFLKFFFSFKASPTLKATQENYI